MTRTMSEAKPDIEETFQYMPLYPRRAKKAMGAARKIEEVTDRLKRHIRNFEERLEEVIKEEEELKADTEKQMKDGTLLESESEKRARFDQLLLE